MISFTTIETSDCSWETVSIPWLQRCSLVFSGDSGLPSTSIPAVYVVAVAAAALYEIRVARNSRVVRLQFHFAPVCQLAYV
jgi:hypothetical protein